MKKALSLALLLLTALCLNAQETEVRTLWDFTQGFSQTTLDNFAADAASADGYWTDQSAKGFYESKARTAGQVVCKVNGEDWVVPETEGLIFGASSAKHLCIQYESDKLGPHVWLNGKQSQDYVTIPQVPAGETITIVYSSHKDTEARGFKVSTDNVVSQEDGTTKQFTNTGRDTVVLVNNNTETTDVKLNTTNGMHFHFICVGEVPSVQKTINIAYVFDSGYTGYSADADKNSLLLDMVSQRFPLDKVAITRIDAAASEASAVTSDSLQFYDVVIVSDAFRTDNAYAQTLKEAIAYVPMLNLSANLYPTWGYGQAVQSTTTTLTVGAKAIDNVMFTPASESTEPFIDADGNIAFLTEGAIPGYEAAEGSIFAGDSVVAKAGDVNVMHIHKRNRNAYMLLPSLLNSGSFAPNECLTDIFTGAVAHLQTTKTEVTKTARPRIGQTFHHQYTTVELSSNTDDAVIYYTTDGTDPTEASTLYTGPFDISAKDIIVKVIANAEGYTLSDIYGDTIDIYELANAPTISFEQAQGQTTVTITPAAVGDTIYYNYTGSDEQSESGQYTEPLVLTKHATVTAFTGARDLFLQSELTQVDVPVTGESVRLDVISHMDANNADWNPGSGSPSYYIGKNGYNFYTETVLRSETYKDIYGADSIVNIYEEKDSLFTHNPGNGWELKTYGQPALWQNTTIAHNVLDFNAYNPQTPEDDSEREITNYCVSFAAPGTSNPEGVGDPASACLQTTVPLQGPFDVVTYVSGKNARAEVLVTNDTINGEWTKLGDVLSNGISGQGDNGRDGSSRIWKKTILPYEGTDQVFVKLASGGNSANIFDIFIKNEGEKSKAYTGIVDLGGDEQPEGVVTRTMIFNAEGTQIASPAKGFNMIKKFYSGGAVKTQKVIIR